MSRSTTAGHYKSLVEKLGEVSLEIEATLDELPAGAQEHGNDRFNPDRRNRDITNEEEQLMTICALLSSYQEERTRLDEFRNESTDDVVDDAVNVGDLEPGGYGLMSQTRTHYAFGGAGAGPAGTPMGEGNHTPIESPPGDFGLGLGMETLSTEIQDLLEGAGRNLEGSRRLCRCHLASLQAKCCRRRHTTPSGPSEETNSSPGAGICRRTSQGDCLRQCLQSCPHRDEQPTGHT